MNDQATMSQTNNSRSAILITGASTGIGRACALELDRRGFRVFSGVRSRSAADSLRAAASSQLTPVTIDVTDAASIAAAAEEVGKAVGHSGLFGLVNNAGVAIGGPVEIVPIDKWRRQFEVNVLGQVAVTQAFLPLLRKARGRIVNISSNSGGQAGPYMGPYCASKFALEAITDALRVELRTFGIAVSAVEPGPIQTPIWEKSNVAADEAVEHVAPEVLALYQSELDLFRAAINEAARTAAPVERVVRAVVHAMTAKRPKTRYFLGWPVRVCFKGMKMLPDRLRDWIVRKAMGLP
jgi:NAD(P)-dependent dehydrogenase (short-subunit alcohol dehydrogenase family)